mmetsp:Transcript_18119/g.13165  ORF Transcript_18119/g.13165 Transcript_18119/m.13165 type:complete len:263 (-) Transcript_18119:300-1088(-)
MRWIFFTMYPMIALRSLFLEKAQTQRRGRAGNLAWRRETTASNEERLWHTSRNTSCSLRLSPFFSKLGYAGMTLWRSTFWKRQGCTLTSMERITSSENSLPVTFASSSNTHLATSLLSEMNCHLLFSLSSFFAITNRAPFFFASYSNTLCTVSRPITTATPSRIIPAFSTAIFSSVSPSASMWSHPMVTMAQTTGSTMLVASSLPPRPHSRTAKSTPASLNFKNAIRVTSSKNVTLTWLSAVVCLWPGSNSGCSSSFKRICL